MTPSEAHDSAWRREPGHDEMALAVLREVRAQWPTLRVRRRHSNEPDEAPLEWSGAEVLFHTDKGHRWFADIALRFDRPREPRTDRLQEPHWRILEIKPRIHSAGALIRQLRVQEENALGLKPIGSSYSRPTCDVLPVVRSDDPLAQLVADLWECSILTWDGSRLSWLNPRLA